MTHANQFARLIVGLFLVLPFLVASLAFAQGPDIASSYEIADSDAGDGDILVVTTDKGIIRATTPYDSRLFGVLQEQPLLAIRRSDNQGKTVARFSNAEVNVTTANGEIAAGDYITSSEIPGVGQKATVSGYVIGIATSGLSEKDGQQIDYKPSNPAEPVRKVASGKVTVVLRIEYAEITKARAVTRAFDSLSSVLFSSMKDPGKAAEIFRYLAAGMTVLSSFAFGFFTFSRSVPKAIEAIGRNPLAGKSILFSVVLNILLTVATAAIGIIAAVFIIKL